MFGGDSRCHIKAGFPSEPLSKWLLIVYTVLISQVGQAQVKFTQRDLPSQPGDYNCSFISSNVDVSLYLKLTTNGAPFPNRGSNSQVWTFSEVQHPDERFMRTDIIAPDAAPNAGSFSSVSYAEQTTIESNSAMGWSFYGFSDQGRIYYGFDEPVPGVWPVTTFFPPTIDIPATVQMGQIWARSLYWPTLYPGTILVSNYLAVNATVDATGSLSLPQIGTVNALRVHEVHSYTITETGSPTPLDIHTNDCYYWLVPGLGVAVKVTLYGTNTVYQTDISCTNTVERMYFANYFTNANIGGQPPTIPPFQTNLQISLQGTSVILNWNAFTNNREYEIDFSTTLQPASWQPLIKTVGNVWTDSVSSSQRFYRVVGIQ